MKSIVLGVIALALISAGAFFCYKGADSWGWWVFAGILVTSGIFSVGDKDDDEDH